MKTVTKLVTLSGLLVALTGTTIQAGIPSGTNPSATSLTNGRLANSDEPLAEKTVTEAVTELDPWYSTLENQDELEAWLTYNASLKSIHQTELTHFLGDFYSAGMNNEAIESAGINPVLPYMEQVNLLNSWQQLPRILGILHKIGIRPFFDLKASAGYISPVATLPDYVTSLSSAKQAELISGLLELTDEEFASIEKSVKVIQSIDDFWMMEAISFDSEIETEKEFGWKDYLSVLDGKDSKLAIRHAHQIQYAFAKMSEVYTLEQMKTYLNWRILESTSPNLSYPFRAVYGQFFPENDKQPRFKQLLKTADLVLGDEFSRFYMPKLISGDDLKTATAIVKEEKIRLKEMISTSGFLSGEERRTLVDHVDEMVISFGHPETLNSLTKIEFSRTDYVGNLFKAQAWKTHQDLQKTLTGKVVVEASVYAPERNELVLTAGYVFQPLASKNAETWSKIRATIRKELVSQILGHSGINDSNTLRDLLVSL